MSKGRYFAKSINKIRFDDINVVPGSRIVLGIDVAKEKQLAALLVEGEQEHRLFNWIHPRETEIFFGLVENLTERGAKVEAVTEPTGTYGDPLVEGLRMRDVGVFRVQGKQVHDMREALDRVPSLHDPKAAVLLVELHLRGASERWREKNAEERSSQAMRQRYMLHANRQQTLGNQLEALMARHWPELGHVLPLIKKTILVLLSKYGDPAAVASHEESARELMKKTGRNFLTSTKIEAVLESARNTCGVPMDASEKLLVQEIASEALRSREKAKEIAVELERRSRDLPSPFVALLGRMTALSLIAFGLDPTRFSKAKAFEKALGLNIRETSSGRLQGRGLHITKRGCSEARQLLYYAALRLIKNDPIVRAWYDKKVARDGGRAKTKAVVAVMRKLARALWYVARGEEFDASRLFDTSRLVVGTQNQPRERGRMAASA